MESLILSFNAIAPIFVLMLLGYFLKKLNIADKKGFDAINKLVFKIFLPVLLFYNIYKTDIGHIFDVRLIVFVVAGVVLTFTAGYFAVIFSTKDNAKRGVMLQGFFRSNFAILGVPLVGYICGDGAGGLASMMVAVVIPVFNILSVTALECFRGGNTKLNFLRLLKGIITNPLIIGCLLGIAFFLTGIKLPGILEKSVKDISSVATPLAIIVLGSEFEFSAVKGCLKELVITVVTRLVLVPLIMVTAAVKLGFTGEALACILVIFAAPVAVSSFSMAQQMDGDEQLAAQLVVISSALCLLTLFGWIFSLGYFNLF